MMLREIWDEYAILIIFAIIISIIITGCTIYYNSQDVKDHVSQEIQTINEATSCHYLDKLYENMDFKSHINQAYLDKLKELKC